MSERSYPESSGGSNRVPRHQPGEFDFEAWSQLAKDDSAAFFRARRRVIDAFIASAPDHAADGLHQLQNSIDNLRACAGSPLKAAWQITGLMQDHIDLLGHQLEVLKRETDRLRGQMDGGVPRR